MWPTELLEEEQLRGWLDGAEQYRRTEVEIALWVANTSFPTANATAGGYSLAEVSASAATGLGARTFALPAHLTGVSHGICVRDDAILVTTSEDGTDPSNAFESVFVVPTTAVGELQESQVTRVLSGDLFGVVDGMRGVASFDDGSIVLCSGGGRLTRVTLEQLLANDWSTPPPVWLASSPGSGFGYELVCVPGTHQVWVRDWTGIRLYDLDSAPGAISPLKHARGSNLGVTGGFMALTAELGLHVVREHANSMDVAYFGPAVLNALTGTQSNPTPTNVMTSTEFPASFDGGVSIYAIDLDADGGGWIGEYRWDTAGLCRSLHFSADALAEGGAQLPDRILTRPFGPNFAIMRLAPGFGLFQR